MEQEVVKDVAKYILRYLKEDGVCGIAQAMQNYKRTNARVYTCEGIGLPITEHQLRSFRNSFFAGMDTLAKQIQQSPSSRYWAVDGAGVAMSMKEGVTGVSVNTRFPSEVNTFLASILLLSHLFSLTPQRITKKDQIMIFHFLAKATRGNRALMSVAEELFKQFKGYAEHKNNSSDSYINLERVPHVLDARELRLHIIMQ